MGALKLGKSVHNKRHLLECVAIAIGYIRELSPLQVCCMSSWTLASKILRSCCFYGRIRYIVALSLTQFARNAAFLHPGRLTWIPKIAMIWSRRYPIIPRLKAYLGPRIALGAPRNWQSEHWGLVKWRNLYTTRFHYVQYWIHDPNGSIKKIMWNLESTRNFPFLRIFLCVWWTLPHIAPGCWADQQPESPNGLPSWKWNHGTVDWIILYWNKSS